MLKEALAAKTERELSDTEAALLTLLDSPAQFTTQQYGKLILFDDIASITSGEGERPDVSTSFPMYSLCLSLMRRPC